MYDYGYSSSSDVLEGLLGGGLAIGGILVYLSALIIPLIIIAVVILVMHYVEAIPVFKLAKKAGIKYAWVALIPIKPCSTFVLASIPGEKEVSLLGKKDIKRTTAIIIYFVILFVGVPIATFISGIIGTFLGIIPFIGIILAGLVGTVIGLIPGAALIIFEYSFLKDITDLYDTGKSTALIITIINYFVPIVRGIYLWTLIKKEPLTQNYHAEFSEV